MPKERPSKKNDSEGRESKKKPEVSYLKKEKYGWITVLKREEGPRIAWSDDYKELHINVTMFSSDNEAQLEMLKLVGKQVGFRQAILNDPIALFELSQKYPTAWKTVLRLQGLKLIASVNKNVAKTVSMELDNNTLLGEFLNALDLYALTGSMPDNLSKEVEFVLNYIPKSKEGINLLEYIASGKYQRFDGKNFYKYILPMIEHLAEIDEQNGNTEAFEYQPSTEEDFGEEGEIDEASILVKVFHFYGGYFRERACRYDAEKRKIVKRATRKRTWQIGLYEHSDIVWKSKRTYTGIFSPDGENTLKLPYKCLPIITSIKPANMLVFMRDNEGTAYVELKNSIELEHEIKFSFDYVLADVEENRIDDLPIPDDYKSNGGMLDTDAVDFLNKISAQLWMSNLQKARAVVKYIHKRLTYPKDKEEMQKYDNIYNSAGKFPWFAILKNGKANCYWSNLLRDEMCKRLGIASRVVEGFYVGAKDPRFDFAVVQAVGVAGHLWGEVWDEVNMCWVHQGMDATPPKMKDKDKQQNQEEGNPEGMEGDFADVSEADVELSSEEVAQLYEELMQMAESASPKDKNKFVEKPPKPKEERNFSHEEWTRLRAWLNFLNQVPIEPQNSILKRKSNIQNEWTEFFTMIYDRRKVINTKMKGPVRRSEGDSLHDPITAYIEIAAKQSDPLGYQYASKKHQEEITVSSFDADMILDVSGSMQGEKANEQQKLVLLSLYNIRLLNQKFNAIKDLLVTPLQLRSSITTFGSNYEVLKQLSTPIDEKCLIDVSEELSRNFADSSNGLYPALERYLLSLNTQMIQKIKQKKLRKVLTIVSDGDVGRPEECANIIKKLREIGVAVIGIGFGRGSEQIKVVCHDPNDPDAAVVVSDYSKVSLVQHKFLAKHMSKI